MYTTNYFLMEFNPSPWVGRVCSQVLQQDEILHSEAERNRFALHHVQSGSITVQQQDRHCTYAEGSVFLLHLNQEAHLVSNTPSSRVFVLCFTPGQPAQHISERDAAQWEPSNYTDALLPTQVTDPDACRLIGELMRRYLSLRKSNDPARYIRIRACFSEIVANLTTDALAQARHNAAKSTGKAAIYCDLAKDYIGKHLNEKISVEAIARLVGISYNYLNRQFVRLEGLSLVAYINRERIRLACRLLAELELSQEELADAVGIFDVIYLRRLFRRYTGMTITGYRKMHR